MLTKFNAVQAYEKTLEKMIEWENTNITTPITDNKSIQHYEHLCSMSEYLFDSLQLGAEEVLLNIAEVNSLVREVE